MSYSYYLNKKKRDTSTNLFDSEVHMLYTSHKGYSKNILTLTKSFGEVGIMPRKEIEKQKQKYKLHNNTEDFISKNTVRRNFSFIIMNTSPICVGAKNTIYSLC